MNILFCCETVYQLIVASSIAADKSKNCSVDLLLFDTIANVDLLRGEIEENSRIYNSIYVYRCNDLLHMSKIKQRFYAISYKAVLPFNESYDELYFADYDWVVNSIIRSLKKENVELQVYMIEDGYATYSVGFGDFFDKMYNSDVIGKLYYKRGYGEFYNISKLYVYTPKLMDWTPPFEVCEIKKITSSDDIIKDELNRLFDYNQLQDVYSEDIIFFEESYYADGKEVPDIEMLEKISAAVGIENIMVKIHPRNRMNRFKQRGFKTNQNTEIPWEVIALNIDLQNKILITIASGSALTALINMQSKPKKIIMLMNCDEVSGVELTPTLPTLKKLATANDNVVVLPNNLDECISHLQQLQ